MFTPCHTLCVMDVQGFASQIKVFPMGSSIASMVMVHADLAARAGTAQHSCARGSPWQGAVEASVSNAYSPSRMALLCMLIALVEGLCTFCQQPLEYCHLLSGGIEWWRAAWMSSQSYPFSVILLEVLGPPWRIKEQGVKNVATFSQYFIFSCSDVE